MSKLFMYGGTAAAPVQLINMSKVLIVKIGTFFIFINLVNGRGYLEKMLIFA